MSLTPNQYQDEAAKTAVYPQEVGVIYCVLGLGNEAGEMQGKMKKYFRGDYDLKACREMMIDELGDVQWYLSELARNLGITLEDLMIRNLDKLADRKMRGPLKGSGDTR